MDNYDVCDEFFIVQSSDCVMKRCIYLFDVPSDEICMAVCTGVLKGAVDLS